MANGEQTLQCELPVFPNKAFFTQALHKLLFSVYIRAGVWQAVSSCVLSCRATYWISSAYPCAIIRAVLKSSSCMKTNAADYAALVSSWNRGGERWGREEASIPDL